MSDLSAAELRLLDKYAVLKSHKEAQARSSKRRLIIKSSSDKGSEPAVLHYSAASTYSAPSYHPHPSSSSYHAPPSSSSSSNSLYASAYGPARWSRCVIFVYSCKEKITPECKSFSRVNRYRPFFRTAFLPNSIGCLASPELIFTRLQGLYPVIFVAHNDYRMIIHCQ